MSVKLRSIDRWQLLSGKMAIPFPGKRRPVTMHVNVDQPTVFRVVQGDGRPTLLRAVQPWECPLTITWVVPGDCTVVAESKGEVWWSSDDGAILSYAVLTESFTELEQRMEMTPELEVTILKANLGREQRLREQAELLLAKRQREEAAAEGADPETGEVDDGTQEPLDPDAGTPEPEAAAGNSPAP